MEEALAEARRAVDIGEVPVGAVVVSAEGEILARSHNRRQIDMDPTGHAELIAMREAAKALEDWRLEGCTVYVTLEPCPMCAGTMVLSRIATLCIWLYGSQSRILGSLLISVMAMVLNHEFEVTSGVMADECSEILAFFLP